MADLQIIVFLGAPGSGKGTIAALVAAAAGCERLATGDLLRAAVQAGTPLGRAAGELMRAGQLVPDDLVVRMVAERLAGAPGRYLFDGFPRTLGQARRLEELAGRAAVTHVFLLAAPPEVIMDRLGGRRVCRRCGAVFHVRNIPPRRAGVCDACGGELEQRADDRPETVASRLEVYRRQTEDLIAYYERQGLLQRIDSAGDRDRAAAEILAALRTPGRP